MLLDVSTGCVGLKTVSTNEVPVFRKCWQGASKKEANTRDWRRIIPGPMRWKPCSSALGIVPRAIQRYWRWFVCYQRSDMRCLLAVLGWWPSVGSLFFEGLPGFGPTAIWRLFQVTKIKIDEESAIKVHALFWFFLVARCWCTCFWITLSIWPAPHFFCDMVSEGEVHCKWTII